MIVLLLCLVPLVTLVHRNDVGRWEMNRCAMAAPDELSYLIMAKSIAAGHGIRTTELVGRDTFYPPGYPLLLAGWGKLFGFSIKSMHVCTALLLCAAMGLGYLVVKRIVNSEFRIQNSELNALLILALCVVNWHVLEGALFIFSEPAFMLATFAWLLLALRWREWHLSAGQTLVLALLAAWAFSIRGAGIVCFGAMLLYPLVSLIRTAIVHPWRKQIGQRLFCLAIVVAVAVGYQALITRLSPEKGIAGGSDSSNSYSKQLIWGLSDGGRLHVLEKKDWGELAANTGKLVASHVDDFSESFVPWFREDPRPGLFNLIGKLVLLVGLAGWLWRCVRNSEVRIQNSELEESRFAECFVGLYIALYLIWPFNMPRFWAPLLPLMLAYVVIGLREFGTREADQFKIINSELSIINWMRRACGVIFVPRGLTIGLLALLLVLHGEELFLQFPHYQRRLNYVSDALAEGARRIVKLSPDATHTSVCVIGGDEHFVFAWYLPAARGGLPSIPRPKERFEDVVIRKLHEKLADPTQRVFAVSYFTHQDVVGAFGNMRKQDAAVMAQFEPKKVFQKGIEVAVWEFVPVGQP